jgi:hypothetical protein
MKTLLGVVALILSITLAQAQQQQKQDTIIVELAKTTKVIFTIEDRKDLEILKHYNFQELFEDIITKLEQNDTTALVKNEDKTESETSTSNDSTITEEEGHDGWARHDDEEDDDDDDDDEEWDVHVGVSDRHWGKTWQSFNFDLGTNNFLKDGKFPDSENAPYAVRPWGSWYVGLNSIQRTRVGRKFFIEWGAGVSWYNFKFQNSNIILQENDNGVEFIEDTRDVDFKKSKLSMSFVQASMVPVVDFGGNSRKARMWEGYGNSFRIGLGPYIGYRIMSHTKVVYNDGDREKDKNRDNFYLNNVRYGARLQLGYRSTDLFFNYDLNELFTTNKGPKLNAFSFGVIF